MQNPATTEYDLHPLVAERWSPRAFDSRPIPAKELGSLFEAARWAASCFNEQPWTFLVATRDDPASYQKIADTLMPANAAWATNAPVLALSLAKQTFTRNGNPNRHAGHDLGLAVGNLLAQAQSLGVVAHQMGGFDADKARKDLGIPDDWQPMAAIALGYPGSPDDLPEELATREKAPRERKDLAEMVFGAEWGSGPPSLA